MIVCNSISLVLKCLHCAETPRHRPDVRGEVLVAVLTAASSPRFPAVCECLL